MPISGFAGFKSHLPDLTDKQAKLIIARLPSISLISLLLAFFLDNSMRFFYQIFPNEIFILIEPWIPIIVPIILIVGGIRTAQVGFFKKDRLIQEYQTRAYQKIAKVIFTGIALVFGGIFYAYVPHGISALNPITTLFSSSFLDLFGFSCDIYVRSILGLTFLVLMIGTAVRAVKDFGIDNAGLVYVYFPEEARVVHSEIYSVVRHPMYMALVMLSFGGFCFQLSIYSIIHLVITSLGFTYHIYIEEKELINRLGDSYKSYRKRVPAILIKPKNWIQFFKFLFGMK